MNMENTSNTHIEQAFEKLAKIKRVEPSEGHYEKTLKKIQNKQQIPLLWVKIAACLLAVFFASELYLISKREIKNEQEASLMITRTNNILYHE